MEGYTPIELLLQTIELFCEFVDLVSIVQRQQRENCYPNRKFTDQGTNEIIETLSRTLSFTRELDNEIGRIFDKWFYIFNGLFELCWASKLLYILDVAKSTGHVVRKIQYELVTLFLILQFLQPQSNEET